MKDEILRTRREFLGNCAVATFGLTLPQFITSTAHAVGAASGWEAGSAAPIRGFKDGRILIVVQLSGGNDGLNTLIPFSDDAYHRVRPRLAVAEAGRIRIDDDLAMHSSLAPLKKLYDRGKVALIEGVGYPNPDRSHFRSMEIWHTASDSDSYLASGWIGRYFDNYCSGSAPPTTGVFLGPELPQAFDGERPVSVAVEAPERFGYIAGHKGDDSTSFRKFNAPPGPQPGHDSGIGGNLDFLRHMTAAANTSSDRIREIAGRVQNAARYPGSPFAHQLSTIAKMIAGGLGTRIFYVSLGGFDTHANQRGSQSRLLRVYAEGIAAFMNDLGQMGLSHRVAVATFSEFGRRVSENASGGTDHGTAAPMFLIGDFVQGGLKGKRPSLTSLDNNGDLIHTVDFRSVYAEILTDWFEVDASTVVAGSYARNGLFRV